MSPQYFDVLPTPHMSGPLFVPLRIDDEYRLLADFLNAQLPRATASGGVSRHICFMWVNRNDGTYDYKFADNFALTFATCRMFGRGGPATRNRGMALPLSFPRQVITYNM